MTSNLNTKSTTSASDAEYRFATADDLDSLVHELSRKIVGGMMSMGDAVNKYHNQVLFEDDGVKVMIDGEQLQRSLERAIEDIQPAAGSEESRNTEAIYRASLAYAQYKGVFRNQVNEEVLEEMVMDIAALCREYGVNISEALRGEGQSERVYYVTVRNGSSTGWLAGPYDTHEESLANVERAKKLAIKDQGYAVFYAYGTASLPKSAEHLPKAVFTQEELAS